MKQRRKVVMPNELGYCNRIAEKVRVQAAAGVPVSEIFASIQRHQKAPRSLATFYKYYRDDMDEARGKVTEQLGQIVIGKAAGGDLKAAELWLTTKGGWSKQSTQTNVDLDEKTDDSEKNAALDVLLGKLGMGK